MLFWVEITRCIFVEEKRGFSCNLLLFLCEMRCVVFCFRCSIGSCSGVVMFVLSTSEK